MDVDPPQATKSRPPGKNKGTGREGGERTRAVPRQSEASAQVETKAVLEDILSTMVQFPLRTILGSSKEISHALQEYIRPRNRPAQPTANQVSVYNVAENEGVLIRVKLEYNGVPVTAIVDTGSQLNIIREGLANSLNMPID
ncbi:hypothetical protein CPB83DRAFT_771428, partial [Crepidotus variabilis]